MVLFTPQKGIYLNECASCVGPLEGKGPLGEYFDFCFDDEIIEEESYEKAEAKFAKKYPNRRLAYAIEQALHKVFSEKNIRGEWFNLSEADIAMLKDTLK